MPWRCQRWLVFHLVMEQVDGVYAALKLRALPFLAARKGAASGKRLVREQNNVWTEWTRNHPEDQHPATFTILWGSVYRPNGSRSPS